MQQQVLPAKRDLDFMYFGHRKCPTAVTQSTDVGHDEFISILLPVRVGIVVLRWLLNRLITGRLLWLLPLLLLLL